MEFVEIITMDVVNAVVSGIANFLAYVLLLLTEFFSALAYFFLCFRKDSIDGKPMVHFKVGFQL